MYHTVCYILGDYHTAEMKYVIEASKGIESDIDILYIIHTVCVDVLHCIYLSVTFMIVETVNDVDYGHMLYDVN